jgi:hypothetical protein
MVFVSLSTPATMLQIQPKVVRMYAYLSASGDMQLLMKTRILPVHLESLRSESLFAPSSQLVEEKEKF